MKFPARVSQDASLALELTALEAGAPVEKVLVALVREFCRLPPDWRASLILDLLTTEEDRREAVQVPKEAGDLLKRIRQSGSWSQTQLASAAIEWFAGIPLVYRVEMVQE